MSTVSISDVVIALVGRPNVGKSTLFNVLTKSRDALVADYPGLTRDRKYGRFDFHDTHCIVIDTGGLSGESEAIDTHMAKQTHLAIDESDIILFMVDARAGLTPADQVIAESLRRGGKQVSLIVNKTDGLDSRSVASEFYSLGLGEPIAIASSQNRGIQSMLAVVLEKFAVCNGPAAGTEQSAVVTGQETDIFASAEAGLVSDAESVIDGQAENETAADEATTAEQAVADEGVKVAIIGRPNVGKSTLVNRFLGEERVIVFDMPGTTRDSVFIPFQRDGKKYTFIDTAGVRRKRAVHDVIEKFSIIKSMQAIERANVVLMMIDARTEISDQDLHLIGYVLDAGRALILLINKWDGMDEYHKELIRKGLDKKLPFVRFAETFFISALHGSGVGKLYEAIDRAYASAMQKFSTSELTRLLEKAVQSHQPPMVNGHRIKLRYAHQGGMNPPRIIIHGNQVSKVPASYQRYLTNFFRHELRSVGTPIKIEFKGSDKNPYASS